MRATLLESNPDVALALPCLFKALGLPLAVVGTIDAVRRATRTAGLDDFVIIDCSLDRPEDRARCVAVVRQTNLAAHVIYTPAAPDHAPFRREVERATRGDVKWLPATVGLLEVVAIVRAVRDEALQARVLSVSRQRPLTEHQQRVWALLAAGRSHPRIADAMGSSAGSVKRDIARIKDKLGVDSTEQLKVAFRWASDR